MLELVVLESDSLAANTVLHMTPNGLVEEKATVFGSPSKDPQFRIHFEQDKSAYFITDMGQGNGTFVKIKNPVPLRENLIVSFGDNHMIVQKKDSGIHLQFIEGQKSGENFEFSGKEKIMIGRMVDCKIRFDDQNLSRYQCTIQYDEVQGWVILDGDGIRPSMNGTWLFADEEVEIYDGLVFKSSCSLFRLSIIN